MVLEAEVRLQGNHGNFYIQSETWADLSLNVLVFIILFSIPMNFCVVPAKCPQEKYYFPGFDIVYFPRIYASFS